MSDLPAERSDAAEAMRDLIETWYRTGAPPAFIALLVGVSEQEVAAILAGSDDVLYATATPERLQRVDAIMTQWHAGWLQLRAERLRRARAHDTGSPSTNRNGHHREGDLGGEDRPGR